MYKIFPQNIARGEDPKWWLGHRCRLCALRESGTLLRFWRTTSAPWIPSQWKASPCQYTLREQVGCCTPASPPGLHHRGPLGISPAGPPAATHLTARWPPPHWATAHPVSPAHWHTSYSPPQEDSSTTRRWLQTCLGDTEKQDWMLKE
jgi:hypothetical protein